MRTEDRHGIPKSYQGEERMHEKKRRDCWYAVLQWKEDDTTEDDQHSCGNTGCKSEATGDQCNHEELGRCRTAKCAVKPRLDLVSIRGYGRQIEHGCRVRGLGMKSKQRI